MSDKKFKEIILETYRMLYKEATPSADFDELVENCTTYVDMHTYEIVSSGEKLTTEELVRRGWQRKIPYEEYFLDDTRYREIVDGQAKKYKLKAMWLNGFNFEMYLGCGPTSVRPEDRKGGKA